MIARERCSAPQRCRIPRARWPHAARKEHSTRLVPPFVREWAQGQGSSQQTRRTEPSPRAKTSVTSRCIESRRALEDRSAQLSYVHESGCREVRIHVALPEARREEAVTGRLGPRDGTLSFDLAEGLVRLGGEARVLLPASVLLSIVGAATGDARRAFGRALGESIGHVATIRMKEEDFAAPLALVDASPEAALSELAAAWALAGLGSLGMERWGRALVMSIDNSPLGREGDELLEVVLEGALESATERRVHVLRVDRNRIKSRFFVGNANAVAKVRALLEQNTPWADALSTLHTSSGGGA